MGEHRNDFSECDLDHPLELHHKIIEFSMQNGVDLAWLEVDYPGVSNPDAVGAWVETGANFEWLCVTSQSPILMADGSERPICDVMPGDSVVTLDGTPQVVAGIVRYKYRGDVISFGRSGLTPSHRMLTDGGWLSAAEVFGQLGVHGQHVVRLRREEYEVSEHVVCTNPVDVMNSLSPVEQPPNSFRHYGAMLQDRLPVRRRYSNVAFSRQGPRAFRSIFNRPGDGVQADHSASIGTVVRCKDVALEHPYGHVTDLARGIDVPATAPLPTFPATNFGTTRIVCREGCRDKEVLVTDGALSQRQRRAVAHGWWDAPPDARVISYTGFVHDLIIPHNHSMVTSGVVIHNCRLHHRGHGGVHSASASDFEAEKYVRGLIR